MQLISERFGEYYTKMYFKQCNSYIPHYNPMFVNITDALRCIKNCILSIDCYTVKIVFHLNIPSRQRTECDL